MAVNRNNTIFVTSDGREELHPLYNRMILKKVIATLKVTDACNFRLVCTPWNRVVFDILRKDSIIRLRFCTLKHFYETFSNSALEPEFFSHYILIGWDISFLDSYVSWFWDSCGSTIKSVEFVRCRFFGIDAVRRVLFNSAPKLERLYMRDCSFYQNQSADSSIPWVVLGPQEETRRNNHVNGNMKSLTFFGGEPHVKPPINWEEMLHAYPHLERLELWMLSLTEVGTLIRSVNRARKQGPRSNKLRFYNGTNEIIFPKKKASSMPKKEP